MGNYKAKNNNITVENPDTHFINQGVKINITSSMCQYDAPQCNAQRRARPPSGSSPVMYMLHL